ncbi:MAG: ABC-F family ATP-binding cassette domain-containing protein [Caldisericia bacterium]|nr:ABC-F family ATP-binding cassette domain-containing protein [Caldisericia bacterium]
MIYFENISIEFGERVLFNPTTFRIPDKTKWGIIGKNGTGKTSLFRSILGEISLKTGHIQITPNNRIGYLPQDLVALPNQRLLIYLKSLCGIEALEQRLVEISNTIQRTDNQEALSKLISEQHTLQQQYEKLDGYSFEAKTKKVLSGLGFKLSDTSKNCLDFSGGWKMRIHLALLLLQKPDILLLDEPTNHLDTESMEWLEDFLRNEENIVLTISHDKYFLEKLADHLLEIERQDIQVFHGKYSAYQSIKAEQDDQLLKNYKLQQRIIKKEEQLIERFRYKANKASLAQSRIKKLEKIERIEIPEQTKNVHFRFCKISTHALDVVRAVNVSKWYGDLEVLSNISLTVNRGEKVAIVGVNGAGKSTFARLISLSEEPTKGIVELGSQVKMGFFAQESFQSLSYDHTMWDEIQEVKSEMNDQERKNLLGAFLFHQEDFSKKIAMLSGGEKSRLILCKLLMEPYNLLILDEPTNHLDLETKQIFLDALKEYNGTLIIISHDRSFLDEIITKVVEIRNKSLYHYFGNYSYFIRKRKEMLASEINPVFSSSAPSSSTNPQKSPLTLKEQKRIEAENRAVLGVIYRKIEAMEAEIGLLENEIQALENSLCQEEVFKDGLEVKKIKQLILDKKGSLPSRYERWHQLETEKEETELKLEKRLDQLKESR